MAEPERLLNEVRTLAGSASRMLIESGRRGDLTEESLGDADAFLDEVRGAHHDRELLVVSFGCYLGEVMCAALDGRWRFSRDEAGVTTAEVCTLGGSRCAPMGFVAGKLGPEGDYKSLVSLVRGLRELENREAQRPENLEPPPQG